MRILLFTASILAFLASHPHQGVRMLRGNDLMTLPSRLSQSIDTRMQTKRIKRRSHRPKISSLETRGCQQHFLALELIITLSADTRKPNHSCCES